MGFRRTKRCRVQLHKKPSKHWQKEINNTKKNLVIFLLYALQANRLKKCWPCCKHDCKTIRKRKLKLQQTNKIRSPNCELKNYWNEPAHHTYTWIPPKANLPRCHDYFISETKMINGQKWRKELPIKMDEFPICLKKDVVLEKAFIKWI